MARVPQISTNPQNPLLLKLVRAILIYMANLFIDNTTTNSIMDLLHSDEPQLFADFMDQSESWVNDNMFPDLNFDHKPGEDPSNFDFEMM